MFILRFIGRILSIGFILFITFIFIGKNAEANSGAAPSVSSYRNCEYFDTNLSPFQRVVQIFAASDP